MRFLLLSLGAIAVFLLLAQQNTYLNQKLQTGVQHILAWLGSGKVQKQNDSTVETKIYMQKNNDGTVSFSNTPQHSDNTEVRVYRSDTNILPAIEPNDQSKLKSENKKGQNSGNRE